MRTLGLDIGDVRVGVAVSDPTGAVATPLTVLSTARLRSAPNDLTALIEEYDIARIVVGLPTSLSGEEGSQARHVRALASKVLHGVDAPILFMDERLSSTEAKRRMAESGLTEREMRGSVDKVAAAIFLQTFLDSHRA